MMKKTLGVILFCTLAFAVSASERSLSGGPARTAALGGQEIALPDSTSVLDLYENGFSAAIFTRPQKNIIEATPLFNKTFRNYKGTGAADWRYRTQDIGFGTLADSVLVWFSPDMALAIRPMAAFDTEKKQNTGPSSEEKTTSNNTEIAGEAELAKKFGPFALAAAAGYSGMSSLWKQDNLPVGKSESTVTLYKIFYQATAAFFLPADKDAKLTAALSFGNRTGFDVIPRTQLEFFRYNGEITWMESMYLLFYNYHRDSLNEDAVSRSEYSGGDTVLGFRADAAAAYEDKSTQLLAQYGLIFGVKDRRDYINTFTNLIMDMKSIDNPLPDTQAGNGVGYTLDLKARKDFGPFIASAKFSMQTVNAQPGEGNSVSFDIYNHKTAAGFSIKVSKETLIPLEFVNETLGFAENNMIDRYSYELFSNGVKAGIEQGLGNGLTLRAGIDYTTGGNKMEYFENGELVDSSGSKGTPSDPYLVQTGYNLGAGFVAGQVETNLNLRYLTLDEAPLDNNHSDFYSNGLQVLANVRILL